MDLSAPPTLLQLGHHCVLTALRECAALAGEQRILAVDATCGNGNDSLFLAQALRDTPGAAGNHAILALDIQQQAIESSRKLLCQHGLDRNVRLFHQSHDTLAELIKEAGQEAPLGIFLAAVMFNLGYLPRSDKRVTTCRESTLPSLETAANAMNAHGLLSVHAYGGHHGGSEELAAVDAWCASLDPALWKVARYSVHNQRRNPEALFLLRKRKSHE